jgi:capsular exopolysaccharide synthesis family protein
METTPLNNGQVYQPSESKLGKSSALNPYDIVRKVILPFWPVYAIALVIAFFAARVYIRSQIPVFQVFGKVLLKENGGAEGAILKEFDIFAAQKSVDNEIEIIRSSDITNKVVRNLNTYVSIRQEGKVRTNVMPFHFAVNFEALDEDSINGVSNLELVFSNDRKTFTIGGSKYKLKDQIIVINGTEYQLTVDQLLASQVNFNTPYYLSFRDMKSETARISNSVTATQVGKKTTIIAITYSDQNIENAQKILNELVDVYTNQSIADKRRSAQFSLDFIDQRLRLINGELDSVERSIEEYKSANGIFDISSQASIYLSTVKETDQKIAELDLQLSVLADIENYVNQKQNSPGTVPSVMGFNEPLLSALLTKLYELETDLSKRKKISGFQDEMYVSLEEEIIKTRRSIKENIRNIRSNLNIAKINYTQKLGEKNGLLSGIPAKERTLIDISRQQSIKNEIYTYLLEKREESAISFAATVSDIRIIEKAFGGAQVAPKPTMNYVFAFSISFIIPFLFVYWWVLLNPKIKFREDIESLTEIPIIGEIMYDDQKRTIIVGMKDRGIIAESVRTIRTKISNFRWQKKKSCHTILVSSSVPGEGKTFVSVNLGISFSLSGQKVLLIGADMRKPTLHKPFKLQTRNGLSSYLSGANDVDSIIYPTEYDGLSIIPSGVIPPNPTELFESEQIEILFADLKKRFDLIIIDTPPLGLVSDAELMAKFVDMSIFVVRQNKTHKDAIGEVIEKARKTGLFPNVNLIFNGLKPTGIGRYAYYGYGGYGYSGYGYGGYGYGYGYYGGGVKKTGYGYFLKKLFK